jgi:phosphoglucomutase
MPLHPQAGQPAKPEQLVDLVQLEQAYYSATPDPSDPQQRVSFGTSGHRGSSLRHSFNEAHILAITQAICEYRQSVGTSGPLFIGKDTHALSRPAQRTALEVLAANQVQVRMDQDDGYTPTPVMSHAILTCNRGRTSGLADGIIITPSHNPPEDGGFKYNPPHGGPADNDVTKAIENRANELLAAKLRGVKRISYEQALKTATTARHDFVGSYLGDLAHVVDVGRIKAAKLRLGVDPLGGAAVAYWRPLAERYGLDIQIVNEQVDATFGFMTLDWDGKIRMDCSSPYAMASLIKLKDRFDLA